MSIFRSQEHMNIEQLKIAEEFTNMIETEYQLCVKEIIRTGQAITKADEYSNNIANREMDSLQVYWKRRLFSLLALLETRDIKLSEELKTRYLSSVRSQTDWLKSVNI